MAATVAYSNSAGVTTAKDAAIAVLRGRHNLPERPAGYIFLEGGNVVPTTSLDDVNDVWIFVDFSSFANPRLLDLGIIWGDGEAAGSPTLAVRPCLRNIDTGTITELMTSNSLVIRTGGPETGLDLRAALGGVSIGFNLSRYQFGFVVKIAATTPAAVSHTWRAAICCDTAVCSV